MYFQHSGDLWADYPELVADAERRAHARRWTNRQSGYSAVRDGTAEVLIVAEAMHDSASADVPALTAELAGELTEVWAGTPVTAMVSRSAPRFTA